MSHSAQLQFAPFSSALDSGFWHKLTQLKLDVYGLDDQPRDINGYYCNFDPDGLQPHLNLDYTAFSSSFVTPSRCCRAPGFIKNTNTLEEFKDCDKQDILEAQGRMIWDDIISGRAIEDPSLLARFLLLTYADLKKYNYYYWFSFTAVVLPDKISILNEPVSISKRFSRQQLESLIKSYDERFLNRPANAFLIQDHDDTVQVGLLSDFQDLVQAGGKILLAVCDPCTLDSHPGWPLRNLLTLAAYHWANMLNNSMEVICWRDRFKDGVRSSAHSLVFNVSLPTLDKTAPYPTKCTGWEKNEKQKLGPRVVNLSTSMDPTKLAESAVDLNLKLMKWRLQPNIDLDKISKTKCLLLGAGTLGCNVARCLLAWGVRTITLVDNGSISYSNPVRQSLFVFEDSLDGGKPKAEAAADALKRIFPGVMATGISLSIPMPGHPVSDSMLEQVREDVGKLEELIDAHDAVFLLMDTRESRWLPTMITTFKRKITINSALGFDTYLVVRHAVRSDADFPMDTNMSTTAPGTSTWLAPIPGTELGCYFCNDVVAPGDSTKDRTLDQQCTVSRPGMSMIAGALSVELLVSLLVHPLGGRAEADTNSRDELTPETTSLLGLVPHQIRGFLSQFHQMLPASRAFDKCTACSNSVLEAYRSERFNFLLKVFNTPGYLEELTGLAKLHEETVCDEVWALDDDEEY